MANDMQWTDRDLMLQANKAHQADNVALRTENNLLREAIKEMFEYVVDDIEVQSLVTQETWDRWQDIIEDQPIQLRLF